MKQKGYTLVELMIGGIFVVSFLIIVGSVAAFIYGGVYLENKHDRTQCQKITDTDEAFEKCLEKLEVK